MLESGKIEEVDYVAVDISPDPKKSPWPQQLRAKASCPPSVTLNFTLNGKQVTLTVQHNDHLELDSIPVMIGDGVTTKMWADREGVRHIIHFMN